MGLQRFPIGQFQGGINYRDASQQLEANEAQDGLNVTLAPLIGTLQERAGKMRFDSSGMPGAGPIDNMMTWYPDGTTTIIALSINGTIYFCTPSGVLTSIFAGTAGTTWAFVDNEDASGTPMLWAMNGVDPPKKITSSGTVAGWANTPPNGTMLSVWKNRMIVSGVAATPQRIFFSNIADPENPTTGYGVQWKDVRYTEDDVDQVTGLMVFADWLLAFKRNSLEGITNGNPPWDSSRLASLGMESRFQSCIVGDKAYFFNRTGLWSLSTEGALNEESSALNPLWTTNKAPHQINFQALGKVRVIDTSNARVLCAMPLDGSATNNYVMELIPNLNFRRLGGRHYVLLPACMLHSYPVSAFAKLRTASADVTVAAASDVLKLHTLFEGSDDDGAAISSFLFTGWKGFQEVEPYERVRRVNIEFVGEVTIDVYVDFAVDIPSFTQTVVSVMAEDQLWDGGTWDGGPWNAPQKSTLGRVRPETRARYHAFKFSNEQLDSTFKIFDAEVAFRGGKEH